MLKVGLTGGIGAGKSTVATMLADRGALVVDADVLARAVVSPGSAGLAAVVEAFGPQVLTADGCLDRAVLGRLVFADPERRGVLERIVHPLVARRTERLVRAAPSDAVLVHDVPLLVEKGMGAGYHLVVMVDAPEQVRVDRLVQQRGMGADDAWARIRAQADAGQRRVAADVWVSTDQPREQVATQVQQLWSERLVPFERNVRTAHRVRRPEDVELVGWDPRWPEQAARLLARMQRAAGERYRGAAHVGSTSVPGLVATPVLDLQLGVDTLDDVGGLCRDLTAAGFVVPAQPRTAAGVLSVDPGPRHRVKLSGGGADPAVLVHLHVLEHGGPEWRTALMLRDWWRVDEVERAEYAAVKQRLRASVATATEYAAAKEPWLAATVPRALDWARRTRWRPPPS